MGQTKDFFSSALDSEHTLIAAGASLSSGTNLGGLRLFGLDVPDGMPRTVLTFEGSVDGGQNWRPVKSLYDGSEISCVVDGGGYYPLPDPRLFSAVPMLRVRTGLAAAPVAQSADRLIGLVLRSI